MFPLGVCEERPPEMGNTSAGLIETASDLADLCARIATRERLAFDTEFIPERTYTPQLCLIQVITDQEIAAIDPLAVTDVSPFWRCVADFPGDVIVHAGKHEMEFCVRATGRLPSRLVDVQLAAGFVGMGHPLSYTNLVSRVLGKNVQSGETRTDWSQRPLSDRQIEYALDDVRYLIPIWQSIQTLLDEHGRQEWYQRELEETYHPLVDEDSQRYRRVSGAGGLRPRGIAVMREIVAWREERARAINRPPRWVLRDDIITELAKRQPETIDELRATRGLGLDLKSAWGKELLAAIRRGLDVPEEQLPRSAGRKETPEEQMVTKILAAAMIQRASEMDLATGLVGSNEDLRDLLDWYRQGEKESEKPRILSEWRGEVAGKYLLELLSGHVVARISSSPSGMKLNFELASDHRPTPSA